MPARIKQSSNPVSSSIFNHSLHLIDLCLTWFQREGEDVGAISEKYEEFIESSDFSLGIFTKSAKKFLSETAGFTSQGYDFEILGSVNAEGGE